MKPESLLFAALQKSNPTERAAYLDEACGTDRKLRQEIEDLIKAHESQGEFMEKPAVEQTAAFTPSDSTTGFIQQSFDQIGPYKLREKLGEGGMGTVYVADQKEPVQRRVAIKLIKGGSDSKGLLARFEQERQALAMMDHPNIAKVFDAGVFERTPYFVMELIKGVPITKYCDDARLSPKQRLELFIPVCQAVQHAHQKGIIHRDLKPSNILIGLYDGKPISKVIDFGVAKATGTRLTDQSIYTEVGSLVGTLEYMSPEQAELNNLDIDTRSDIYALGVILYELLTGSVPFSRKDLAVVGFGEMLRVIKEVEPSKPSTKLSGSGTLPSIAASRHTEPAKLSAMVRGELDWIVMKCLEKDRGRRYETANQLGLEIQRYLSDEPVLAGPPSAGYRLRKFVARNKGKVLAAALVAMSLMLGSIGTTIGLFEAKRQEQIAVKAQIAEARRADGEMQAKLESEAKRAEAELQKSRAESGEKLASDRLVQVETEKKKTVEEKQIADAVRSFLQNKLLSQADTRKQANALLMNGGRSSEVKENPTIKELLDRAARELTVEIIEKNFANQPTVQAEILKTVGEAYLSIGADEKAVELLERSVAIFKQYRGADHADTLGTQGNLALAIQDTGKLPRAIAILEQVSSAKARTLGAEHPSTLSSQSNLAGAFLAADRLNMAIILLEKILAARVKTIGINHADTFVTSNNLAMAYLKAGQMTKAIALFERLRDIHAKQLGAEHPDVLVVLSNLALAYRDAGKLTESIELFEQVRGVMVIKLGAENPVTLSTITNLADAYKFSGKLPKAIELLEQIRDIELKKYGAEHPKTLVTLNNLASAYKEAGKVPQAIEILEMVMKAQVKLIGADHTTTLATMNNLAGAYHATGKKLQAIELFEKVLSGAMKAFGNDHPNTLATMNNLALAYQGVEKLPQAIEMLEKIRDIAIKKLGTDHPNTLLTLNNLARAYLAAGKVNIAIEMLQKVHDARVIKLGPDHPHTLLTLDNLSEAYRKAGNLKKAIELLEKVLAAKMNKWGADSSETLTTLHNLGVSYSEAGQGEQCAQAYKRFIEGQREHIPANSIDFAGILCDASLDLLVSRQYLVAEGMLREAIGILENLQPDAWNTFNTRSILGGALLGQKKYTEAEPLLLKGYEGMKQREKMIPPQANTRLPEALDRLIQLYTETNKPDEVKKWKKELDTLNASQKEAKS